MSDELDAVYRAAAEIYRPAGVLVWMRSPNPLLDGDTPIERVNAGKADSVLVVLDALASGATL
jgi:hypothetical protein